MKHDRAWRPPRGRLLALTALGAGMTAAGAGVVAIGILDTRTPGDAVFAVVGGLAGVLFFGFATRRLYALLRSGADVLRLDAAGLHAWGYPSVAAEAVARARPSGTGRSRALTIDLHDPVAFRNRMPRHLRLQHRANRALQGGDIHLSPLLFDCPLQEVAEAVEDWLAAHGRPADPPE